MTTNSKKGWQGSAAAASPAEPSRRTVLVAAAALSLAALPMASSIGLVKDNTSVEMAILKIVRHREAAVGLGEAAQASWPQMRNREALLSEILDDLALDAASAMRAKTSELARRLSRRIQMDFSQRRTLNLDGWVLSLAEVRFYALAAFPQPADRRS
jgi:hypothetical protein